MPGGRQNYRKATFVGDQSECRRRHQSIGILLCNYCGFFLVEKTDCVSDSYDR